MRHLPFSFSALLILIFAACHSTQRAPVSKLVGPTWTLSSLMGASPDASKFPTGLPTLNFLEGEGLAGFAGCNNFSGSYRLAGSEITLDPGAVTRKACPGSGESDFLVALQNAKILSVEKEKLTLVDGTTELMSFVQKKE